MSGFCGLSIILALFSNNSIQAKNLKEATTKNIIVGEGKQRI
jgi:hypothetical protein